MQLRGWNSALAAAAGIAGTVQGPKMPVLSLVQRWVWAVVMAFTYQALVKLLDAAAVETGDRAPIGAA